MVYADYAFYTDNYLLGKQAVIDTALFPFYARQASFAIDGVTFGKATDIEPVKLCCCELAELMYSHDSNKSSQGITSEKVDSYAVSYAVQTQQDYAQQQYLVIRKYLADTGLLYCGV